MHYTIPDIFLVPDLFSNCEITCPPKDGGDLKGFLPQMDEFYFTTAEKKILENCRCIVPNFMS